MNTPQRFLCALALTSVLACSSDDTSDIDVRDAHVGWDATSRALADARAELDAHVPDRHDGALRVDCDDGGAIDVFRELNEAGEFRFDADFHGCARDGLTIDGSLTLETSVAVDAEGQEQSAAALIDYTGHLELSGSVEGDCTVDAQLRVGAATIDHHTTVGAAVSGTLCGHDAATVLGEQAQS